MDRVNPPTFTELNGELRLDGTDRVFRQGPIRTLYVEWTTFYLSEGASARALEGGDLTPGRTLVAKARLEKDSLRVIGGDQPKSQHISFIVHADPEINAAPGCHWAGHIGFHVPDEETELDYEWWIEVSVPQAFMDTFVSQYRANRIQRVSASLKIPEAYADEADWYGQAPAWGMDWYFKPQSDGGTMTAVRLTSLSWREMSALGQEVAPGGDDQHRPALQAQPVPGAISLAPTPDLRQIAKTLLHLKWIALAGLCVALIGLIR